MEFEEYYDANLDRFESLSNVAKGLIENLIRQNRIEYLTIESRIKTKQSCLEKIKRKKYKDARSDITDIVGVRVIVYFEHQIDTIANRLGLFFENKEIPNPNQRLGTDKIGYRSYHLDCSLGAERGKFEEYKGISDLQFEVQIRTVLQHAWAELAHDRSYKLTSGLPNEIQRKVNLYAGLLEIADSAFSEISQEIETYSNTAIDKNVADISIDVFTVDDYLRRNYIKFFNISEKFGTILANPDVIDEIKNFGISNISELDSLISDTFLNWQSQESVQTQIGFIRDVLMWTDLNKYLQNCFEGQYYSVEESSVRHLEERFKNARRLLKLHEIAIEDDVTED